MTSSTVDRRLGRPQFYTYVHCKPNGEPFYVGKGHGSRSIEFGRSNGRNPNHERLVSELGRENIGVFRFDCESEQDAMEDEKRLISQLRRDGFDLVNVTGGGQGVCGLVHSEATRAKISEKRRLQLPTFLGRKHSDETKAKISAHSASSRPEVKAKISAACLGYRHTPEAKAKIGAAAKGKKYCLGFKHTLEACAKMSQSHMGNKCAVGNKNCLGRKPSAETLARISAARKGKPWTEARWAAHKGNRCGI